MINNNMNNIALKFLKTIKQWVDKRIPEKTKDCLRTKIAVITNVPSLGIYDVILAGDYGTYLDYKEDLKNEKITQEEFDLQASRITLNNLITIKTDDYCAGDYVVIGIVDNKLTNSFILYKSVKKGV